MTFSIKKQGGEPILTKNTDDIKVSQGSYSLSLILGWELSWRENSLPDITGQRLGSRILLN